jgi:M6 family metalloprotease-like protein
MTTDGRTNQDPALITGKLPTLQKCDIYCSEAATDYSFYACPIGTRRAIMLFVEFPDALAGTSSARAIAQHLLGDGSAQRLFKDQSYGKFDLAVTVRDDLGWRRLPTPATGYDCHDFYSHRQYVTDAANLFARDIAFSDYDFALIVAPETAPFPDSPAFNAAPGQGAQTASGEVRLAVTFGRDSYRNSYVNLVHEVSHLIGLPDLYEWGAGADTSKAGCWDLMSDIFHCDSFLGWHRYKNGWLDPQRLYSVAGNVQELEIPLVSLKRSDGVAVIVVPLDGSEHPAKILCIELTQSHRRQSETLRPDGVLMYTVDARIATGQSPVHIRPKQISHSPELGYLYEAPFLMNDSISFVENTMQIDVTVLQRTELEGKIRLSVQQLGN